LLVFPGQGIVRLPKGVCPVATKKATRKGAPAEKAKTAAPRGKPARPAPVKKTAAPRAKPARPAPAIVKKTAPVTAPKRPVRSKVTAKAKAAVKVRAKAPVARPKRKIPKIKPPPPPPPFVAVGDWISLRPGAGQLGSLATDQDGEVTQGIICSIREIATGKMVAKSKEDLGRYLLEVLHLRTFRPQFSSNRNVGPASGSQVVKSPAWRRIQEILRNAAKERRFFSYATGGLPNELFGSLLDGWRVVRARAAAVEYRE
jgi:hypothetical protein